MSFSRSERPFFSTPAVYELIERVAAQKSLVIYAGAGVTIDRTGLAWPDLVHNLLKKHKPDQQVRRAIMATNTPLQAASIVSQLYSRRSDDWRTVLGNDIRALLYEGRAWRQGELATAVVKLAAALVDHGKEYYLATTNYDEFIQQEMALLDSFRAIKGHPLIEPRTSVIERRESEPDFEIAKHIQPRQILHLHGYVPSVGSQDTTVVLSERDYMASYERSSAVLEELFGKHSVIIIGSSLVDPPLLSALANTVPSEGEGRLRIAVMPLQGMGFPPDSDNLVEVVKDSVEDRMASFHVRAMFPDFYYQVAQLLTEIKISLNRSVPASANRHGSSSIRYRKRLDAWWRGWRNGRDGRDYKRQQGDHKLLCDALRSIKSKLEIPRDETVKLEIWVRWDPSATPGLRLWASTTSLWRHTELMRCADIVADSEYASIKAFCLGRPGIYPSDSDRWKTYLCVPIRVNDNRGDLPVAVISLASMQAGEASRIHEKNGSLIRKIILEDMKPVAKNITAA